MSIKTKKQSMHLSWLCANRELDQSTLFLLSAGESELRRITLDVGERPHALSPSPFPVLVPILEGEFDHEQVTCHA